MSEASELRQRIEALKPLGPCAACSAQDWAWDSPHYRWKCASCQNPAGKKVPIRETMARFRKLHEAKWGPEVSREKWLNNIVEECAELIQAVQHYKRKRVPFSAVRIEMADVSICIDAMVGIEDKDGPPLTEDIARIAQYQVDILAGVTPQIHNDGETTPPNPVPVLVRSFPVDEAAGRCSECDAKLRRVDDITILCPVCVEEVP